MFWALTATFPSDTLADTSVTAKLIPTGTLTRTCSGTAAVSVVVRPVSGSATVVCAMADRLAASMKTAANAVARPWRRARPNKPDIDPLQPFPLLLRADAFKFPRHDQRVV